MIFSDFYGCKSATSVPLNNLINKIFGLWNNDDGKRNHHVPDDKPSETCQVSNNVMKLWIAREMFRTNLATSALLRPYKELT